MPIAFDLKQFLNPVFIETGLWRGHGVVAAIHAGFEKIYSIEVDERAIGGLAADKRGRKILKHVGCCSSTPPTGYSDYRAASRTTCWRQCRQ